MPIKLDSHNEAPPVTPGTNAHELLAALLEHPEMGFTPKELAEMTTVPHSSVGRVARSFRTKPTLDATK